MSKEEVIKLLFLLNSRYQGVSFLTIGGYLNRGGTGFIEPLRAALSLYKRIKLRRPNCDSLTEFEKLFEYFYPFYLAEKLSGTFDTYNQAKEIYQNYDWVMEIVNQKILTKENDN